MSEKLEYCFGKNLVKRSFSKVADTMKEARENKTLYVNSLTEGLATISNNNSKIHFLGNKKIILRILQYL